MACCGQRRAGLGNPKASSANVSAGQPHLLANSRTVAAPALPITQLPPPVPLRGVLELEYLETSRILVSGPATGRQYEFSQSQRLQNVDARDAVSLLRSGFFRQKR